jgi:hypothetical protein
MRAREDREQLGEEIAMLSVQIDVAMHRLLIKLREFDEAEGWWAGGFASCAHWLSWRVGWDLVTARERVRVARKLPELPRIAAAFEAGTVSYSQVRAMTRVATAGNEDILLHYARHMPAAQLDRLCRSYASCKQVERTHADDMERRTYASMRDLPEGMARIQIDLPVDQARRLWAAMNQAGKDLDGKPFDRAGGAVQIAEAYLRGANVDRSPTEVIMTVPAASLRGADDVTQAATYPDGTCMAPETARRLACDAGVVTMVEDEQGEVLDVGRRTRTIPASIKRALLRRDGRCRFPGCQNRQFVDGHHLHHWADGGATSLANLVSLCSKHHRFVHEHHWTVELDDQQQPTFRNSRGSVVRDQAPRAEHRPLSLPQPPTHECKWEQLHPDYRTCIARLADRDDLVARRTVPHPAHASAD